jgi:hypothetical protein
MTKKKKEWCDFPKQQDKELVEDFKETFSIRNIVIYFVDFLIGFLISQIIETPLLEFSHFLRTLEWTYKFDVLFFFINIGINIFFVFVLYLAFKPIRNLIEKRFIVHTREFPATLLGVIFAFTISDVFELLSFHLSIWITDGSFLLPLGRIMDRIIASMILIVFYLFYYFVRKRYI